MSAASQLKAAALASVPIVALQWLVAAGTAAAADGYEAAPWLLLVLNQLVLAPSAVCAALFVGGIVGGRVIGLLSAILLFLLPTLGVLYALSRYRDTYVDRFLTEAVGIADGGRFPAAALSLLAVALTLAALTGERPRVLASAGGVAAGVAALAHPSGALVLVGVALAFAVAWRPIEAGLLAVAALPGVAAAAAVHGFGLDVTWAAFSESMAGLREYLWSNRLLQWLPLAGLVAVARGSFPAAFLLGGWFGAFAVVYGASPQASVEDGSFLVSFVPALPAFCLLVACLPLLVPTAPEHLARFGRRQLRPFTDQR